MLVLKIQNVVLIFPHVCIRVKRSNLLLQNDIIFTVDFIKVEKYQFHLNIQSWNY